MGFLTWLTGAGPIINKGLDIIDQKVEDKDLKNTLQGEFRKLALLHRSLFVTIFLAGPKPALMWIAAIGFFLHYIGNWFLNSFTSIPPYTVDPQDLYALLGLGGASILARSWEKVKKATGNH